MSNRREFLLLADTFKADKHDPIGMIASEKLDGNRVFWDGGVSRGDDTVNVPWASIHHPKTGELKDKIKPKATGLWSRYGNPIQAPDWFLDQLPPNEPLDGELYAGRGNFQLTQTIVRRDDPNAGDWSKITFTAFGAPTFGSVFQSGLIKNANFLREIDLKECLNYIADQLGASPSCKCSEYAGLLDEEPRCYADELCKLDELLFYYLSDVFNIVYTEKIRSMAQLDTWLKSVTAEGGEGLMLRHLDSVWYPKRRPFLLKVKPRHDAEATIVGFTAGRKGKTGQFLGKLGTLNCVWHGDPTAPCGLLKAPVEFEVGTGLTHADREVHTDDVEFLAERPGERVDSCVPLHFKIGDRITFSYMGVTNDNTPREPAFIRIREADE